MQKMQIKEHKNGWFVLFFFLFLFLLFVFVMLYRMQRGHSEYVKMVHSSPFDHVYIDIAIDLPVVTVVQLGLCLKFWPHKTSPVREDVATSSSLKGRWMSAV